MTGLDMIQRTLCSRSAREVQPVRELPGQPEMFEVSHSNPKRWNISLILYDDYPANQNRTVFVDKPMKEGKVDHRIT